MLQNRLRSGNVYAIIVDPFGTVSCVLRDQR